MLRPLKTLGRKCVRQVIRTRLNLLPLSASQAEWYAEQVKRLPSVLGELNYRRDVELPSGVTMNLGFVDVIERSLLTTSEWDPLVEQCLSSLLKPGDTFLDVGANIGYFSLLASKLVGPAGTVVSFEPSARALSRLTLHICRNQCRNVLVCSHAVGETGGRSELNWSTSSNIGGSAVNRGTPSQGAVEQISVRRLDDVCRELALKPNLIKMDIEGFELFALRGAREMLLRHHPHVVCELTGAFLRDHGQSSAELVRFMEDVGYRAFLISMNDNRRLVLTPCRPDDTPAEQAEVLFSILADPVG